MTSPDRATLLRERAERLFGLSDREIDQEIMYIDDDKRDELWGYIREYRAESKPTSRVVSGDGPIATPQEAIAAYAKYGSDRKAASVLGISRTQVRRLRGVEK